MRTGEMSFIIKDKLSPIDYLLASTSMESTWMSENLCREEHSFCMSAIECQIYESIL